MNNRMFPGKLAFLVVGIVSFGSGCVQMEPDSVSSSVRQAVLGGGAGGPQFSVCVHNADASNQPVSPALYCDNSASSSLQLKKEMKYVLAIHQQSSGSFEYEVTMDRVDIITTAPAAPVSFSAGNNLFTAPGAGDYAIKVTPAAGGAKFASRTYQASVVCNAPVALNAAGLDASKITASAGSGDNLYSFSASGIVGAGAGGVAPYFCAWDFDGDGTRDSVFRECSESVGNVYVNYVEDRKVGVIVKDSCNTAVSVNHLTHLPLGGLASIVAGGGREFIHGRTSGAAGTAAGNAGTKDVNYWATNSSEQLPVQANFVPNGANSVFTIRSDFSYGLPSSDKFGMKFVVTGLNVSLGNTLASSQISAANAKLSQIEYSTDSQGDALAQLKLSGTTCTAPIHAEIIQVVGEQCQAGTVNPAHNNMSMKWTVHVWADYSCTGVSGSGGSMNVDGAFEGAFSYGENCIGVCTIGNCSGGGGGGYYPAF